MDALREIASEAVSLAMDSGEVLLAIALALAFAVIFWAWGRLPGIGAVLQKLREAAPPPQLPSAEAPQPDVAGGGDVESKWSENVAPNDEPLQPDRIGGG